MEKNFYQDDDFEQFLQDEVKQHRMYPSDHIWKNIRTDLHGYKAWPALTFISLFIITALTISTLLINHPDRRFMQAGIASIPVKSNKASGTHSAAHTEAGVENDYVRQIAPERLTAETFAGLNTYNPDQEIAMPVTAALDRTTLTTISRKETFTANKPVTNDYFITKELPLSELPDYPNTLVATEGLENENNILYASDANQEAESAAATPATAIQENHSATDDFLKDFAPVVTASPKKKNSKFGFQFYVTPSTSYRKLSDEMVKEIIQPAAAAVSASQNIPLTPNYSADINNVVRHQPAMGLELGFALLYNISDRLKFKTGLQLNIRQYYIETFQSTNDLASLSLINYRGIETISFYTPYNNNTGYKQTRLHNKLYQVSIPLGIQWDLIQGKHLGISTEASVQPTMTMNNNTYLMSTDYKHYADGGSFIRKWNINTSLGLNITYRSGSSTWQLGPQVRYQHLPTYSNVYPIKEYLLDYGVRLGFTRQIR